MIIQQDCSNAPQRLKRKIASQIKVSHLFKDILQTVIQVNLFHKCLTILCHVRRNFAFPPKVNITSRTPYRPDSGKKQNQKMAVLTIDDS